MAIVDIGGVTVTTGGTPQRLAEKRRGTYPRVEVTALRDNTGKVYIGNRNITSTTGSEIGVDTASETGGIMVLYDQDPYDVWIDVQTDGDGVKWTAFDDR